MKRCFGKPWRLMALTLLMCLLSLPALSMEEDAQILRASLLTYLVPLAGFIGGLLLGNVLAKTDAAMVLGGLLGLTIAGVFLWLVDKRLGRQTKWQAHILSVNDPDVIAEMEKEDTCPKAASWSA